MRERKAKIRIRKYALPIPVSRKYKIKENHFSVCTVSMGLDLQASLYTRLTQAKWSLNVSCIYQWRNEKSKD